MPDVPLFRTALFAAALGAAGPALAHGGLSLEEDACILRLGELRVHFAGYQPESAGTTEFCEDIPEPGRTIVLLDFIEPELREMPVELRIVAADGVADEWQRPALLERPPEVYPRGSLQFEIDFSGPGDFVGLVAAGEGRAVTARFPFSVGGGWFRPWHAIAAACLLAAVGAAMVLGLRRRAAQQGRL
jgi:hypothetical protein